MALCDHGTSGSPALHRRNLKLRASRHPSPSQPSVETRRYFSDVRKEHQTTRRGHYDTMPVRHNPKLLLSPRLGLRPGPGPWLGIPRSHSRQSPLPVGQRTHLSKPAGVQARSSGSCSTNSRASRSSRSGRSRTTHRKSSSFTQPRGDSKPSPCSSDRPYLRYFTKDGRCRDTVYSLKEKSSFQWDLINTLVDLKYRWIFCIFTLCYIVLWTAFAEIYFLDAWLRGDIAHIHDPQWLPCFDSVTNFHSALSVSMDSSITKSHGSQRATRNCIDGIVLMMTQSIIESVLNAFMLGCILVKLSKPLKPELPSLLFSQHCVARQRDGRLCLTFDVRTVKKTHMLVAEIRAKLIRSRRTQEGEFIPVEQRELNLGPASAGARLFTLEPLNIEHVIDEASPLRSLFSRQETFEIVVMVEGSANDSGAAFCVRTSYTKDEIIWEQHQELCKIKDESDCGSCHRTSDNAFRDRQIYSSQKRLRDTRERPEQRADSVRRSCSTVPEESHRYQTCELFVCSSATSDCKMEQIQLKMNEFFI